MKQIFILITLTISLFAQEKYFINFRDKGLHLAKAGISMSQKLDMVKSYISPKAIARRERVMPYNEIITDEDLPVSENYINELENYGITIIHKLNWFNAVSAYLTDEQLNEIKNLDFIESVRPIKIFKTDKTFEFNDTEIYKSSNQNSITSLDYGSSYQQLQFSNIPQLHELGLTGEGITIGMLDSGFDWATHPAMRNMDVIDEYDFVFNDNCTANENGDDPTQDNHGTYTVSLIGGYSEGNLIGAAYNASFLLAKTEKIDTETRTEEDYYAAALEWMENRGVDITSSSIGYNLFDSDQTSYIYGDMDGATAIVTRAVAKAFNRGVITVTSAGNEGNYAWRKITAPADEFNVISVGAMDTDGAVSSFSSRGPTYDGRIKPEICALGRSVYGANSVGSYRYTAGTSSSTPLVAGTIALVKEFYPHLNNRQIRNLVLESGDNASSPNNDIGWGALSAVTMIEFPNISIENDYYQINKFFTNAVQDNDISAAYSINGVEQSEITITKNEKGDYCWTLPSLSEFDTLHFHYTYTRDNLEMRNPVNGEYTYYGNSEYVFLNTVDNNYETNSGKNELMQNYPNPFNTSTTISFFTKNKVSTQIYIYNILGQKVRTLFNGVPNDGYNTIIWNGRNDNGRMVASGIYFYQMITPDNSTAKKMVLVR